MHSPTNDPPKSDPAAPVGDRIANLSPAQKELLRKRLAQRRRQAGAVAGDSVAPDVAARVAAQPPQSGRSQDVAIVGMGCRFPGAASIDQYWDLIESGREAIGPVPGDRWDSERFFDPTGRSPGKMSVNAMGAIDDVDQFDAAFFGITPREASRMDPQQRLLLEVTWETFENAGIPIESMAGSKTGVFIGIGGTDYSKIPARYPNYFDHVDAHIGTGNALSIAAGRISYLFDFQGPSYIVDTACSSALVAIHNAVVTLATGQCDAAVAGGVNLILSPETTIAFSKARMLSPDGHCRPFDDSANGYVRGEGCGVVLLKRLSDAQRDGDPILGVIRGSAVNQDGRTSGITAPSGPAQTRVIRDALQQANLNINDISYVEAHGTGTPLGDPIELMALSEVFASRDPNLPAVRVGSVKANIGHTETASGIAGLIKVLLMFQQRRIPGQVNFHNLNTNVRFNRTEIQIADTTTPWDLPSGMPTVAGVSSFGFGGTNAHLIVQAAAKSESTPGSLHHDSSRQHSASATRPIAPEIVLPLSAADSDALPVLAECYADAIATSGDMDSAAGFRDICGTAAVARSGLVERVAIVAADADQMVRQLREFASRDPDHTASAVGTVLRGRKPVGRRRKVAMLFTGQGAQYVDMGRRLSETMPVFASALQACSDSIDAELTVPLAQILAGQSGELTIDHTSFAQVAICAVQCALVDTFGHFGVVPDVVAGHSIGEIAALYAAQAISRDDALRIAAHRGAEMGRLPAGGTMAAILASANEVQDWIRQSKSTAVIAAMNGPGNTVIAGLADEVDRVLAIARQSDVVVRPLQVSHAFHSPLMKPAVEPLRAKLASFLKPAVIPRNVSFLSSMTGARYDQPIDVDYWIRHLVAPVRFTDTIDQLSRGRLDMAIEIGPKSQLAGMIRHASAATADADEAHSYVCVPSLNPKTDDYQSWVSALAMAWCVGAPVQWAKLATIFPVDLAHLPTYPFQRQRHWYDPPGIGNDGGAGDRVHPLLGSSQSLADGRTIYTNVVRKSDPNYVSDHVVSGSVTMPAAAWIETLRAAASVSMPDGFELREIEIDRALFLDDDQSVTLQITVDAGVRRHSIHIDSRTDEPDANWQRCASAVVIVTDAESASDEPDGSQRITPLSPPPLSAGGIDPDWLYDRFDDAGLQYGNYFRVLDQIVSDRTCASGSLQIHDDLASDVGRLRLHPTLLDGALQLIATVAPTAHSLTSKPSAADPEIPNRPHDAASGSDPVETYLPVGVGRLIVQSDQPIASAIVVRRDSDTAGELIADVDCLDATGKPVAMLRAVRLTSLSRRQDSGMVDTQAWRYQVIWTESTDVPPPHTGGSVDGSDSDGDANGPTEWFGDPVWTSGPDVGANRQHRRPHWVYVVAPDLATDANGSVADTLSGEAFIADDRSIDRVTDVIHWVQQALVADPPPRLTVVTCRAAAVVDGDPVDPVATSVAAVCRVAANEHPQLDLQHLDVDKFDDDAGVSVSNALSQLPTETESAWRDGRWWHPRLQSTRTLPSHSTIADAAAAIEIAVPTSGAYRIRLDGTNRLDGLIAERIVPPPAGDGEVGVSIRAVGLNFSDVLKAMGLYPGIRDDVTPLGIEIAGTVTKLGAGVDRFSLGDRVMGVVPHGFATDDATHDYLLAKIPANFTDEEAAVLPIAFMTAHHAICNIGRIRRGESILIHAGAGGVGLAAIQVAQSMGATVFATAGSTVKRTLLVQLGLDPDNVFDSRDIRSMDRLRSRTGGRGVDIVLNSLPGEWIDESLRALAPYGRFLEIGKTDIYQNRPVGLAPFQDNLTYSAIDLDRMFRSRADEVRELFDQVVRQFEAGIYRPVPITWFQMDELPAAMRFMAARRNMGKIVVSVPPTQPDTASSHGLHLITGGSGAIAIGLARRLIQRGARSVALVARRPVSEAISALQGWTRQQGAECHYLQADCSDESSLRSAIATLPGEHCQVSHVYHAAGLLDDRLLHETSPESIRLVMTPKAIGAQVLDRALADHPIVSFQMLGSVASVFGSPGQSNYAAANAFLEGFASDRRSRGLPASLVHWGPWAESTVDSGANGGMANDPDRLRNLAARGLNPLAFDRAIDLLIDASQPNAPPVAVVVDADFGRMLAGANAKSLPSVLRGWMPGSGQVVSATATARDAVFLTKYFASSDDDRTDLLVAYFADQLAKIMSMKAASLDPDQPLGGLGLDSLMAIELKNTIEARLELTLPISKFMNDPTLRSLATAAAGILENQRSETDDAR
ncbi:Phenolphthiocerol synthesis polyketide synthase type I Pks15/1 [Rubripirellula lacrimiformis]|uniref:Phenolphthiocerol synthesis polyketide synthase type I Pks15/1 n=1 Tax=Rubripirellula lacrimiformis TaxID=1930273 RepID=A0A517NIL4_9BACT|nr:type I polyketide synthase [Rubripirellula lacrimiformis]QDT06972.1 Phenolphthiocerol synthesis polyketide synthase type I Pks15/1 [Rubripirellula lacrimiformis]